MERIGTRPESLDEDATVLLTFEGITCLFWQSASPLKQPLYHIGELEIEESGWKLLVLIEDSQKIERVGCVELWFRNCRVSGDAYRMARYVEGNVPPDLLTPVTGTPRQFLAHLLADG